jgi:hypothetical protein
MMTSQNQANLAKTGQLKAEAPSRKEFDGLVRSARARLKDAHMETLSIESRFDLGYNAPMLWHLRPCAGTVTAQKTVTSFFNVCNIHWILALGIGGYWRCVMSAATLRNMKVIWKSMNNW